MSPSIVKERILITVKTYPTLSRKYGETVCTAGVREDGTWVRLYPVPFRRLGREERYQLFDWVELRLQKNTSDPRPETFRPIDPNELSRVSHISTVRNWRDRRRILLQTARVYDHLSDLIQGAKTNQISLAVFKPSHIVDFVWQEDDREWNPKKLDNMRALTSQLDLFDDNSWRKTFKVIPKLPYNFLYKFKDADNRSSKLQILDWQIGMLYWNCLRQCDGDEVRALAKVKQKYFDEFTNSDLHLFLGTTQQFHFVAPNPWVIIGVFPIPHESQYDLFLPK